MTRTHVQIGLANPFLICDTCGEPVHYWHDPSHCGSDCDASSFNFPCEHKVGTTSICNSWGPVDGCRCKNKETHDK